MSAMPNTGQIDIDQAQFEKILTLRLIICRAAESDALRWWDDDAMSDAGLTLGKRIFSRFPERALARLAMRAARSRHDAALERVQSPRHLFRLNERFELAFDTALSIAPVGSIALPPVVRSIDELRDTLSEMGVVGDSSGSQPTETRLVAVKMTERDDVVTAARALAAAYCMGEPERPVFPFVYVKTEGET